MPFVVNAFLSLAQATPAVGKANLILPDLSSVTMLGLDGRTLLMCGLLVCAAGLGFGLWAYRGLRDLPVHASMLEVSELIYETCKTYLGTQGTFLVVLELFIGTIIVVYFGMLREVAAIKVVAILMSSVLGILGRFDRRLPSRRIHQRTTSGSTRPRKPPSRIPKKSLKFARRTHSTG